MPRIPHSAYYYSNTLAILDAYKYSFQAALLVLICCNVFIKVENERKPP